MEPGRSLLQELLDGHSVEDLFDLAATGTPSMRHRISLTVASHLRRNALVGPVTTALASGHAASTFLLRVLAFAAPLDPHAYAAAIRHGLASECEVIRLEAARAGCWLNVLSDDELRGVLASHGSGALAEILCLGNRPALIEDLLAWYRDSGRRLPPVFGFLLTPGWLASHPDAAGPLAAEFGYTDSGLDDDLARQLAEGLWHASPALTDVADRRRQVDRWLRTLLPIGYGDAPSLEPGNPVDEALFLAAVREADALNLETIRRRNPYDHRSELSSWDVKFCFAPVRFCRRLLFGQARELSDRLGLEPGWLGAFTVDHARVLLETDIQRRAEADALLRTQWTATRHTGRFEPPAHTPVARERDFPLAKLAVLDASRVAAWRRPPADRRLSPGAQAVVRLASFLGTDSPANDLAELEQAWGKLLPPIGFEVQVPAVADQLSLGWRQALRFLGIPSPRRPEFYYTVEAAWPPARCFHVPILAIRLLARLGLFHLPGDSALHISLQGDLTCPGYLLLPNQFVRLPRRRIDIPELADRARARLMSKGYCAIHDDARPVSPELTTRRRTELRSFCVLADEDGSGGALLQPGFADDLATTHLLAAAMIATRGPLHDQWAAYRTALDDLVTAQPAPVAEWLHGNWGQGTGDPDDGDLVARLPIMQLRAKALASLREAGRRDQMADACADLLASHTRGVHQVCQAMLGVAVTLTPTTDSGIPAELPLGSPREPAARP